MGLSREVGEDQWFSGNTCFELNCYFDTDYRYENKMVFFVLSVVR